jgi:hypothetical protein
VRVAVIGLVALLTTFTSAGAAVARHVSGLRGLVMQGPTKPVCRIDDPCEAPARGILLDFRRNGKVVAEVKTTRSGTYSVRLAPGSYAVRVPRRRIGTGLSPRVVRVPRGRIARVDFHLDTGLQ